MCAHYSHIDTRYIGEYVSITITRHSGMCYLQLHLIGSCWALAQLNILTYFAHITKSGNLRCTSAAHYWIPAELVLPSCATSLFASKHSNEGHYLFGLYGWPLQPGSPTVPPGGSWNFHFMVENFDLLHPTVSLSFGLQPVHLVDCICLVSEINVQEMMDLHSAIPSTLLISPCMSSDQNHANDPCLFPLWDGSIVIVVTFKCSFSNISSLWKVLTGTPSDHALRGTLWKNGLQWMPLCEFPARIEFFLFSISGGEGLCSRELIFCSERDGYLVMHHLLGPPKVRAPAVQRCIWTYHEWSPSWSVMAGKWVPFLDLWDLIIVLKWQGHFHCNLNCHRLSPRSHWLNYKWILPAKQHP